MFKSIKMPKRYFYTITILCGIIIGLLSIETLIRVKDYSLFEFWLETYENIGNSTIDELFSIYVTSELAKYFMNIVLPMSLGIYTYFAYTKLRINYYYIVVWVFLLIGGLFNLRAGIIQITMFNLIVIICYIIMGVRLLQLSRLIYSSEEGQFG